MGATPLVELRKVHPHYPFRIFAKMERFNPGGSIKDRTALSMLTGRLRSGELVPGRSVVVESSSGNLGVGLAQLCAYFNLRFICVVDARTTEHNLAMLRAFQAEVEVVTDADTLPGEELLPARLRRVRELVARIPHAYWPNQYANPLNPAAHQHTMREVVDALDGRVDYLFCATSTGGTLGGCAAYVRRHGLQTAVIAVDAEGSAIFAPPVGPRLLPGHGASIRPPLLAEDPSHQLVRVPDLDAVAACRRLTAREGLLAGGSSGAVLAALTTLADSIPPGANCVLVFPDGGDRYLDTIYSDHWVRRNFGDVSHLWKDDKSPGDIAAC
ncbi:2,3-diaminopropionate biosynthesis protein SbnA [Streptomyces xanthophaeus]|nr:2,3-diaminopropionate biosynthesis protein SbnA [Streptomyces xanthophaeus]WKD37162.1 2,3-diaminopropionate biosynthesis protein SbnA [Streptomyces xanthophaeus]